VLGAGCYTYTPVAGVTPAADAELSLVFTDQGRVGVGNVLGSSLERVDGRVVRATDSAYLLRVSRVIDLRGVQTPWRGETVSVARSWVGNSYERRFSRSRTYLIAGLCSAAVAVFIGTRAFGLAGAGAPASGGGGGGSGQ
jgi:hypothetical protein